MHAKSCISTKNYKLKNEEQLLSTTLKIELRDIGYEFEYHLDFALELFKAMELDEQVFKLISIKGYSIKTIAEFTENEVSFTGLINYGKLQKMTPKHTDKSTKSFQCKSSCLIECVRDTLNLFIDPDLFCYFFLKTTPLEELNRLIEQVKIKKKDEPYDIVQKQNLLMKLMEGIKEKEKEFLEKDDTLE